MARALHSDDPLMTGRPREFLHADISSVSDSLAVATPRQIVAVDSDDKNLHLRMYRQYLAGSRAWWNTINSNVLWHRVKYASRRFTKDCETPCYTAFYGGFPDFEPYAAVPGWLQPLVDAVSTELSVPFNAVLLRLYFDGRDEIAWHTDGRTFLGPTPTIGSLSLGATAHFEMRRMRDCWPSTGPPKAGELHDDGVDHATAPLSVALSDGDLLVMQGDTQAHWHHRVPRAKSRRPRININFRYILPGAAEQAARGQATYYKYMRDGDVPEHGVTYEQLVRKSGSLLGFAAREAGAPVVGQAASAPSSEVAPAPAAPPSPSREQVATMPQTAGSGEWACPQCTLVNPPLAPLCAVCEFRRYGRGTERHEPRLRDQAERIETAPPTASQPPAPPRSRASPRASPRASLAKRQRPGSEQTLSSMWAL